MSGPTARRLRVFRRNKLAVVGITILGLLILFCFVGPLVYHTEQTLTSLADSKLGPGVNGHPLGTDDLGYDLLGRLMLGGQTSLIIGLAAGLLATLIGTLWGTVAGYAGGWVDAVMMRIVDAGIAIPALFLLVVAAAIATPSVPMLILVIGFVSWLVPARLMRAESIALRSRAYVESMKVMGGGSVRAIGKHIIPNAIGTVIVNVTFQIADAVLLVAYVSFLGLGIPPPAANWGGMLSDGLTYAHDGAWWLILPPGLLIVMTVCAFNFIGDGLRDAFDVRFEGR
ncbi:ABC transporter permease [Kibdelosporangium phytohabitans]|uniref:Peptide ABC transporter permease n=1 Tax=Kibdelosporangium phytohabitans TaxID=860235 RepID=A0A0N9HSR2_9PSEU|nr:ABC transporter permease [Kibdelosporangium phytohabitans]ALG05874.1 peptide ABC transporter permease [Kibdelosporangium phytohabitans]MBE1466085.1 peptide/nickel transport system permease protein [Kibdelosporangium phytohabitans]